jgi:hypothetical protein
MYEKVFRDLMGENPKYPYRELNKEDKKILDRAFVNYVAKFYALTQQYSSPKKYAHEVLLKLVKNNSNIATLFTIAYARNSPNGQQIRPGELNEKLANDIRNIFQEQYMGLASELQSNEFSKKFLNPRDLRGVLKKLEDEGIFIHLTTKEEIIMQQHRRSHSRGRSTATKIYNERGGKLSAYILADEVERLKKVMEKPGSIEYLYQRMIESGLAEKLFRFELLAFLYAAKMDKSVLEMTMGVGWAFFQESPNRIDTAKSFQQLQQIDDNKLEKGIDNQIKSIIEDRGYYVMLFFAGLLKL